MGERTIFSIFALVETVWVHSTEFGLVFLDVVESFHPVMGLGAFVTVLA